jgi:hypothetical protein
MHRAWEFFRSYFNLHKEILNLLGLSPELRRRNYGLLFCPSLRRQARFFSASQLSISSEQPVRGERTSIALRCWRLLAYFMLAIVILGSVDSIAQTSAATPRIISQVDESSLVTLKGNVPPLAQARYDRGEAPPQTQLTHIRLVLSRSAEQAAALKQYEIELQDKPEFRS